jgi:hypothetical protein
MNRSPIFQDGTKFYLIISSSGARSWVMNFLLTLHLGRELGLVLGATRIPELGPEPGEPELFSRLRRQEPEEAVMLNTDLPKSLSSTVVTQLEPDGRLELFELSRTKFDEESVPFV